MDSAMEVIKSNVRGARRQNIGMGDKLGLGEKRKR